MTDVDKDKTLCASVTGRDNIPKLKKKTPLGTDGQRHMCSKDKRLKDLAGLASLGQLGFRHWECYGWSKGHVGVEEADRRRNQEESLVYMDCWY